MNEPIKNVEEFYVCLKKLEGGLLLYRGMADASWEVSASACRRMKISSGAPPPTVFQNYIEQLLEKAGLQGFRERQGKKHSDLEFLAELQHNGAATCLIDFTTNAMIALWFACGSNLEKDGTEKDGKVVAMVTDDPERFQEVTYEDLNESIIELLKQNKLWKWEPGHLSNRVVAQQSVFVFGEGEISEEYYESIKIDRDSKKNIIVELEKIFGITEQHLFSDFTGFALSNAHDRPYSDYTAEDHFLLGVGSHQQRDYQKAISHYNKVIKINPQDAVSYYNRGRAKADSGDYPGAISDFNEALEINPQDAKAYNRRGVAKTDLDDYPGAIPDFNKALEINPQFFEAYYNRGRAKADSGDYPGAIPDFNKALEEVNPQYAKAYNNRGHAKVASGDEASALEDFAKAEGLARKTDE